MILIDAWASFVRYLKDAYPDWIYVDFEDHADLQEIPQVDCMGLCGLGAIADEGTDTIAFSVGVSSYNDKNLFRHRTTVADLYERWRRGASQVPLLDADTAAMKGSLVLTDGLTLAPMSRADIRPFQILTAKAKVVLI